MRLAWAVFSAAAACSVQVDFSGTAFRCGADQACPSGFQCVAGECRSELPSFDGAPDAPPALPPDAPAAAPDAPPLPWWDVAYAHRLPLTIVNPAAVPLPAGYQVGLLLPPEVEAAAQGDRDDVRLVAWTGAAWEETLRVEDNYPPADPWIWFALPAELAAGASVTSHWLYFGNPAADSPTFGPGMVMEFYDPFGATTVNMTRWTVLGAPTQVGDELVLSPGTSVHSNETWPAGYAVDFSMEVATWSSRFWGGFQRAGDFNDSDPWLIWVSRSSTKIWPEVYASAGGVEPEQLGPMFDVPTSKILYTVERLDQEIVFRRNHEEVAAIPLATSWTDPQQIRLTNEATTDVRFGMTRVRQVIRPGPTVTPGAVENYP